MHTRKTRWPYVIIGLMLAAALGGLGYINSTQMVEKGILESQLKQTEIQIEAHLKGEESIQNSDLEKRLEALEAQITRELSQLSVTVDTIPITWDIFSLSRECDITLMEILYSGENVTELETVTCTKLPVEIVAVGGYTNLLDYYYTLNSDLTNAVITGATLDMEESPYQIAISLSVYCCQEGE